MADRPAPDLNTPEGRKSFNEILNDRLPTKRAIAQALLRNEDGEILVCQLTYKADLDLPGGVVDPNESPAECLIREVEEELAIDLQVGDLLAVNWLPPYRGWDDAILFLFDCGTIPAASTKKMKLLKREIAAVHWIPADDLHERVADYTVQMIDAVLANSGRTAYLENSRPPQR